MIKRVTLSSRLLGQLLTGPKTEAELIETCGSNSTAIQARLRSLQGYDRVRRVMVKTWEIVIEDAVVPRPSLFDKVPKIVTMAKIRKDNARAGVVAGPYRPVVTGSYVPPPETHRRTSA